MKELMSLETEPYAGDMRDRFAARVALPAQPRYRHIGYAKYVPTTDGGSLLVCCAPDEPGAFRMFREPPSGVPGTFNDQPKDTK